MDEIRIEDLQVKAYHGVYEDEKEKGQNFYVNAVLYTDTRDAGLADDLSKSTDYARVCSLIRSIMLRESYDLIETVAEHIAEEILLGFPYISAVDVEVRKPEAPVPVEFKSISVKIHRAWHDVYISYGSNIGDSATYVDDAVASIAEHPYVTMIQDSERIITAPYGGIEQDDFLNGVCRIRTLMAPDELLNYLHNLEEGAGRTRDIRWGPRTLDLDILLYDDLVYESETLIIPHVDMENREFVLRPMCELAPYLRHPVSKKTMKQLFDALASNK
ncbi:MAG: 2-amino-4-hydroxy-6-hydroxymethyldihydropteridine diphosphokinase [Lachnospiraceae bacterium]|nr:2-amino-4-hydroxy-6-hydroxymethyldihydropteridine diphosphokinase [Lachnospiraceae bacterium]